MTEHGLGRLEAPDERDAPFAMRTAVEQAEVAIPTYRYWNTAWWGDQGATPECVAYAWTHWLELGPVTQGGTPPIVEPYALYSAAQERDEWEGTGYDGTSVRGGAKALADWGFIDAYLWATDAQTVMDAVASVGPVVVGTLWTDDMFTPDANGFLRYTGAIAGGHAYVIDGVNRDKGVLRMRNSWGRNWGVSGRAFLEAETLDRLLADDGEACLATELRP